MKRWNKVEEATTPGGSVMALFEHDGVYVLRVDGAELMSSRHVASEIKLAEVACAPFAKKPGARVLIGGLGLGFTLRAALSSLGASATVVVAELMPQVVDWNRKVEYGLAADCLADPRTKIEIGDVAALIESGIGKYDAIMLDADNNTTSMTTEGNRKLYREEGLSTVLAALRPGGVAVYWSATPDTGLVKLMGRTGFDVEAIQVRAHPTSGGSHWLYAGRTDTPAPRHSRK